MLSAEVFVFIAFLSTHSCAQQRIFQNRKGALDLNNRTLIISCKQENLITDLFPKLNETLNVYKVAISQCTLPETPLVDILKAININSSNVHSLNFHYVDMGTVRENFTADMVIHSLEILDKRKHIITHDFLKTLSNLKVLNISGVELPFLTNSLEHLGIYRDASIKNWDGCENLRTINMFSIQSKKQFPEIWPSKCSEVNSIKLVTVSEEVSKSLVDTVVVGSPNLQSLSMQGCKLLDLSFEKLHSNITYLDLRNNRISDLNREQSSQLFGTRARRVWLSGNPVNCKCKNNQMLEALHMNQSQVKDYDGIICSDGKLRLSSVSVSEVCRLVVMSNLEYGLGYVWGLCCSISVFSVVLLVVTRRYGPIVRTILYSRGYCTSCLRDGVDSDRPYDAFLSFAHGDDEFVLEELLPRLEDTPNEFRVCIHYRDWTVGEWIPAQIMQSVRLSKRTVIVLSKNFVKSWWGVLEFRYAHASAMAEGRSRLLVLILDDVLNEKLQPELQGYLEYHTFLRCSDQFFWDKLRYAMPHKDNTVQDV